MPRALAAMGAHHLGRVVRGAGALGEAMAPEYFQPYERRRTTTTGTRTRAPRRRRSRPADAAPGACALAGGRGRCTSSGQSERGITVPPAYAPAASRPWYAPQALHAPWYAPRHQDRLTPKCEGAQRQPFHATTHPLKREQARYQRHSRLIRQVRGPGLVLPPRLQDVS